MNWRVFRVVLLLGPPLGGLLLAVPAGIAGMVEFLAGKNTVWLHGSYMFLMASYIPGGVPMLVAGLIMGSTVDRDGDISYGACALAGVIGVAIPAIILMLILYWSGGSGETRALPVMVWLLLPCAIFAAMACRYLMVRGGVLPVGRR